MAGRHTFIVLIVLAVFAAAAVIAMIMAGSRASGALDLLVPERGTEIFIDNRWVHTAAKKGARRVFPASAGRHTVLVRKNGYYPWEKTLQVDNDRTTSANPFLMPIEPQWDVIPRTLSSTTTPKKNPAYNQIRERFNGGDVRTTSPDGSISVVIEGSTSIVAHWLRSRQSVPFFFCGDDGCNVTHTVFSSVEPIRSIALYPGRRDVVLAAAGHGIYAVEFDRRSTHNFFYLYQGDAPEFIVDGDTVYVKDRLTIRAVTL